jgi:HK97 family phage major capsid protein
MTLKALIEARNEKVSKMENLVAAAKAENRLVSDEEKKEFNSLKKEVADLDENIEIQKEVENFGLVKAPETEPTKEGSVEDKQRKQFANILRGIRNEDTPTSVEDGKVMIPTTIWDRIISKVTDICPIYEWSDKFNIKGNFVIPKDDDEGSLAVDYAEDFSELESGNVKLASIQLKGYLAGCLAKISKTLINNTNFDIVGYVENKIALKFAKWIEKELLNGTSGKIEGLSTISGDQLITSATAGEISGDDLIDLQEAVPDQYQGECRFIMNKADRKKIRKIKDKEGDYMLNRDLSAKWGYVLLGKEVYTSDNCPEGVIFYGDFSGLATKISEEANIEVLREKYATQHAIGLVAYAEIDARIADTQKIAKLVVSDDSE